MQAAAALLFCLVGATSATPDSKLYDPSEFRPKAPGWTFQSLLQQVAVAIRNDDDDTATTLFDRSSFGRFQESRRTTTATPAISVFHASPPRGGSTTTRRLLDSANYQLTGSIGGSSSSESGIIQLANRHQHVRYLIQRNASSDPALIKTLAFLSDALVLVLNDKDLLLQTQFHVLIKGWQARAKQGLPKPTLRFVIAGENKKDVQRQTEELLAELRDEHHGNWKELLQELYITPSHEYDELQPAPKRNHGICSVVDAQALPLLMTQVYKSFGGSGSHPLLDQDNFADDDAKDADLQLNMAANDSLHDSSSNSATIPMMEEINHDLDKLQSKLEEASMSGSTLPNFSTLCNGILQKLERITTKTIEEPQLTTRIQELFHMHLQSLRDEHGHLYEDKIARLQQQQSSSSSTGDNNNHQHWNDAAVRVAAQFRAAAKRATPPRARNARLHDRLDFDYLVTTAEKGLVKDMMRATDLRRVLFAQDDLLVVSHDDDKEATSKHSSARATWMKKVAARALVLAVNYAQGWVAWQGVKRAAAQREKHFPKFPLF